MAVAREDAELKSEELNSQNTDYKRSESATRHTQQDDQQQRRRKRDEYLKSIKNGTHERGTLIGGLAKTGKGREEIGMEWVRGEKGRRIIDGERS